MPSAICTDDYTFTPRFDNGQQLTPPHSSSRLQDTNIDSSFDLDLMDRVQALPAELRNMIQQFALVPGFVFPFQKLNDLGYYKGRRGRHYNSPCVGLILSSKENCKTFYSKNHFVMGIGEKYCTAKWFTDLSPQNRASINSLELIFSSEDVDEVAFTIARMHYEDKFDLYHRPTIEALLKRPAAPVMARRKKEYMEAFDDIMSIYVWGKKIEALSLSKASHVVLDFTDCRSFGPSRKFLGSKTAARVPYLPCIRSIGVVVPQELKATHGMDIAEVLNVRQKKHVCPGPGHMCPIRRLVHHH